MSVSKTDFITCQQTMEYKAFCQYPMLQKSRKQKLNNAFRIQKNTVYKSN